MKLIRHPWISIVAIVVALGSASLADAANPPGLVNYQGVLRDNLNQPLNGTYLMSFQFIDAVGGGTVILIDTHGDATGGTVVVTDGLFSVQLGGGTLTDGPGPGNYTSLSSVFRDYDDVMLRVEVEGEALSPDVRVLASAYAQNASFLGGLHDSQFLRSDQNDTTVGNLYLAGSPSGAAISQGPLYVNPISSNPGDTLLGVAVGSQQRFRLSNEGDMDIAGNVTIDGNPAGGFSLTASGVTGGAYFEQLASSTSANIAAYGNGIAGYGESVGGFFQDTNDSGYAYLGSGDRGVRGYGSWRGGEFISNQGGGIEASGSFWGGLFKDTNGSGVAYLGYGERGIEANGNSEGGYFQDLNDSAHAYLAKGHRGIEAYGYEMGGYFVDSNHSGYARVGVGNAGIQGYGDSYGGYFEDTDSGAVAYLGNSVRGVDAYGVDNAWESIRGTNNVSGVYASLAFSDVSTWGNGSKSFVQNHPHDKDKVIRYTSLEGDETGTYTRGIGRLANGVARVRLGDTFEWVTNPDIGLTAHLTPRGAADVLFVESLSTDELVVRGPDGSNASFDYLVFGLRIGFEEQRVVTDKRMEAMIPSNQVNLDMFEREPRLRDFTALVRFERMAAEAGRVVGDRSRTRALEATIGRYDPKIHGPVQKLRGLGPATVDGPAPERQRPDGPQAAERKTGDAESSREPESPASGARVAVESQPAQALSSGRPGTWTGVRGDVQVGDVLVLDPDGSATLQRSELVADPAVAGVATGAVRDGEAPVVFSGITMCRVDAGYGEIRVGDLLTVSPTPGHAMRSSDSRPGTIVGKAAESLDSGTGTIRVLMTLR